MAALHISTDAFDKVMESAGDKPVLVDFFAEWCGPCKMIAPVIEELATEYEGKAVIVKVNVDDEPELAKRFGVMSIPTLSKSRKNCRSYWFWSCWIHSRRVRGASTARARHSGWRARGWAVDVDY